jgi:hypothetical protein
VSALSFLFAYATIFTHPVLAVLVGWLVAMVSRQAGHFFFEPKGYDEVNHTTHEHKEDIKIGYNLRRKVVLHAIWAAAPVALWIDPALLGVFEPHATPAELVEHVAQMWLVIGIGALIFRTVHLFFLKDVQTGLVWITKILTDPFNDVRLYYKAPLYLLRGELIDPMGGRHRA